MTAVAMLVKAPRPGFVKTRLASQVGDVCAVALYRRIGREVAASVGSAGSLTVWFTPADAEFARDAVAAECNPNVETVIIHDLDFEQLRRHRETGTVQNWNDRRRDLYRVVYQEDGKPHEI